MTASGIGRSHIKALIVLRSRKVIKFDFYCDWCSPMSMEKYQILSQLWKALFKSYFRLYYNSGHPRNADNNDTVVPNSTK